MAGAEWLPGRPMLKQEFHRAIKRFFFIKKACKSESIQGRQRWAGVGVLCFRPTPKTKLITSPAAVAVLNFQKVIKGRLESAVAGIA